MQEQPAPDGKAQRAVREMPALRAAQQGGVSGREPSHMYTTGGAADVC